MKQQQKIRLYQSRDFSGIFDTSIAFIKQNYGAILKGILVFIPIVLIATCLLMNLLSFSNMNMTSIGQYEDDPFASTAQIAAVTNASGNVFGMMPLPERAVEKMLGSTDGVKLFEAIGKNGSER